MASKDKKESKPVEAKKDESFQSTSMPFNLNIKKSFENKFQDYSGFNLGGQMLYATNTAGYEAPKTYCMASLTHESKAAN